MNKEELQALHEVIDYMWEDEKKSYEECYDCDLSDDFDLTKVNENHAHMFVYLMTLGNYVQVQQHCADAIEDKSDCGQCEVCRDLVNWDNLKLKYLRSGLCQNCYDDQVLEI